VDLIYNGMAAVARAGWEGLSVTENGRLRWYAAAVLAGTILFVAIVALL
jgi:hypothetical protein